MKTKTIVTVLLFVLLSAIEAHGGQTTGSPSVSAGRNGEGLGRPRGGTAPSRITVIDTLVSGAAGDHFAVVQGSRVVAAGRLPARGVVALRVLTPGDGTSLASLRVVTIPHDGGRPTVWAPSPFSPGFRIVSVRRMSAGQLVAVRAGRGAERPDEP